MQTYIATNTQNGKFYIGSAVDFDRRKKEHLRSKENYPFQNALRKNPEVFEWEVLTDDADEPLLEQALLDQWFGKEQCYNLSRTASCPMAGRKHSSKTKRKIQKTLTGRNHTESTKKKMSASKTGEKHNHFRKKWWVNDQQETRYCLEHPGEGWRPGRNKFR